MASLALAGLLMAAGCARATGYADATGDARSDRARAVSLARQVDSLRREARIPGLAMVVLRDTTVLLAQGFGLADVESGRAVTPDTPFNIASVSKPISAVVALRLVQDGLLDLDRPMQRYRGFAEFCDAARGDGGIFFSDYDCKGDALTMRRVLAMQANPAPGGAARFLYNPPAYSWASRPMAEVAGRPFSDLVDSLVLRPAGMTRSARVHRSRLLPESLAALLAQPYTIDSLGRAVPAGPPPPQGDGAAGGVIATANDLARFDIALARGRLIGDSLRSIMWTPGTTPQGTALPYGLGWFIADLDGTRALWHTGLWDGRYSALYLKVPSRRLTLILLANSEGLRWPSQLDEAAIERSPFARALMATFPR